MLKPQAYSHISPVQTETILSLHNPFSFFYRLLYTALHGSMCAPAAKAGQQRVNKELKQHPKYALKHSLHPVTSVPTVSITSIYCRGN